MRLFALSLLTPLMSVPASHSLLRSSDAKQTTGVSFLFALSFFFFFPKRHHKQNSTRLEGDVDTATISFQEVSSDVTPSVPTLSSDDVPCLKERERETDTETDRQTDRQTETETGRHTDRERHRHRQKDRQTDGIKT